MIRIRIVGSNCSSRTHANQRAIALRARRGILTFDEDDLERFGAESSWTCGLCLLTCAAHVNVGIQHREETRRDQKKSLEQELRAILSKAALPNS